MKVNSDRIFRLEEYRPSDYLIPRTRLAFRLAPRQTLVKAGLRIRRQTFAAAGTPLTLDGDGLRLLRLKLDGTELASDLYSATPDRLVLHAPPAAQEFTLEIETELDPAANTALMGLYRSGGNYCTQCEAEGFRRITYFLDRPDILSIYDVRIEARRSEAPLLLSNGNPAGAGELEDGWHYAHWHDPFPKPSYLFALVAGDLGTVEDRFITRSGREVKLAIHVEKGKENRAHYAMDALKRSMRWDEEKFGCEYDLDVFNIVAVPDFNMGAMENKGLNVFNDKYVLADPVTATDADFANIETIIAHEYFHNYTGNRVTCRDWFQLCLKEGLTVYRDHEFSADQRSRPVRRISEVKALKAHQFPEDAGPLAHPVRPRQYREINNFYTSTVYEKGSEVVRMIRTILGEKEFRRGMDLYLSRHDGQAATIEDFLAAFEEVSGRDLGQFSLWYHQAGTPEVTVCSEYDAAARRFSLQVSQHVPPTPGEREKKPMHVPLAFGLVGPDGEDLSWQSATGAELGDGVMHLVEREQRIEFSDVRERPVLSINRGFSAPVVIRHAQSLEDKLFLARRDKDLVARWLIREEIVLQALIDATGEIRQGKHPEFPASLIGLFGELAARADLEPAYRALALTLPDENDIAREINADVDPDAVHLARKALHGEVGKAHVSSFTRLLDEYSGGDNGFSPDAQSAGRRSFCNILAEYVAVTTDRPALALARYDEAGNMTDRMAAMILLAHHFPGTEETARALADFEARFRDDAMVLDKWFQVQAMTPGAATVDTVRRLAEHEAFSLTNPNRVRALIGTFSAANQTGFHSADGAGYRFTGDCILQLEKLNPQVAARLATCFRSWRSLEPHRRQRARAELQHIRAGSIGSPDLTDIIDRTLS